MKKMIVQQKNIVSEERWDFDYHEPAKLLIKYNKDIIRKVIEVADIVKDKKDPTKKLDVQFQYIDIASIDIETGEIGASQELTGAEAPSRARKLVQAYDVIISTVRPTRKATAVVPESLHGEICSTGFSVVRAKKDVNPFYLHFALRLDSTIEQFRKFSTGSSYPAILDSDVEKTLLPIPPIAIQDEIVKRLKLSLLERNRIIQEINSKWEEVISHTEAELSENSYVFVDFGQPHSLICEKAQIEKRLTELPPLAPDTEIEEEEQLSLEFDESSES